MLLTKDVVKAMAQITGGTQKEAKAHLDAFKQVVTESVQRKEAVSIKGLVTFDTAEVAARKAKDPRNKEEVQVAAHTKAFAKIAKSLRKF